jgi:hypothetical protein
MSLLDEWSKRAAETNDPFALFDYFEEEVYNSNFESVYTEMSIEDRGELFAFVVELLEKSEHLAKARKGAKS